MGTNIMMEKRVYSKTRISELSSRVRRIPELGNLSELVVFATGSYARYEASEHSDIDTFFMYSGSRSIVPHVRTNEFGLFGALIRTIGEMDFPPFSNDSQYLECLSCDEMLLHLGSPIDDYNNFFTARMLLLLESKCLANDKHYEMLLKSVCESYFRDFPEHPHSFQPKFLVNDIKRFWHTMLVNYEYRRNLPEDRAKRIKHKVKNFKLQYSRLTTCFATVAAIGAHPATFTSDDLISLVGKTPQERLDEVQLHRPDVLDGIAELREQYSWFLEMTSKCTEDLEGFFQDSNFAREAFDRSRKYGDLVFDVLQQLDKDMVTGRSRGLLRTWVV